MAQGILAIGAVANDGTGTKLRAGGAIINDNFTELYNKQYAEYHLVSIPQVVTLNDDGVTYTKIPNMVLGLANGFSVDRGTLTKDATNAVCLINGTSDVECNMPAGVCYALFVNGAEVPSEVTCHTFANQANVENISITGIAQINASDTIEIRAKGDGTRGIIITVQKLDVTFLKVD